MKKRKLKTGALLLLLTNGIIGLAQKDYTAHEWGTFTTLHGSDGTRLGGLQKEEEHLPEFVYNNYKTGDKAPINIKDNVEVDGGKGMMYYPSYPLAINVKMETPVIYFYSEKEQNVNVNVKFPEGSISEWFPERTNGDTITMDKVENKHGNFSFKPVNGFIDWKNVKILSKNSSKPYSAPKSQVSNTWSAPRETDANKVEVNGDVEKYLFYRGIATFNIPIDIKFKDDKTLEVKNNSKEEIPYVFVYEKLENGTINVYWTGKVSNGKNLKITLGESKNVTTTFKEFEQALVSYGLYEKEAKAMLKTWESSYFKTPGFRVFWIVPKTEVEKILPLKITPKPTSLERVFVGRCDIIKPSEEKFMITDKKLPTNKQSSRYEIGYNERFRQLLSK